MSGSGKLAFLVVDTHNQTPARAVEGLEVLYRSTGRSAVLAFSNWDNDPRELYDIPEVTDWCGRFIRLGGLSYIVGIADAVEELGTDTSSQLLVMTCAGWPEVKRTGAMSFEYDLDRIAAAELQYRPAGFVKK